MVSGNCTTVVVLEGFLTLSNIDKKIKIFKIILLTKLFLFSCINIPDKFLAQTKL